MAQNAGGGGGMKKFLIGCGIVTLLVIVIVCAVGGFFTYQGVQMAKELGEGIQQAEKDYKKLEADFPFTEPEGSSVAMDEARLAVFFNVRENMKARMEEKSFVAKLNSTEPGQTPDLGVADWFSIGTYIAIGVHKDVAPVLREANMPPTEYAYYTRAVYMTLAQGAKDSEEYQNALENLDEALNKFENVQASGGGGTPGASADDIRSFISQISRGDDVPEENVEMLEPYLEQFKADPSMAFFDIIIWSFFNENRGKYQAGPDTTIESEVEIDTSSDMPDAEPATP